MDIRKLLFLITMATGVLLTWPIAAQPKNKNKGTEVLTEENRQVLEAMERTLQRVGDSLINGVSQVSRVKADTQFIRLFVKALKVPGSFEYPFDSLKFMKILKPEDNKFRLYNWVLTYNDATYRYHGAIQMQAKEGLKLFPLLDYTDKLDTNLDKAILTRDKWKGALYYAMHTVKAKNKTYYTLLGWDGNNFLGNRKIIEALHFEEDGQPIFGAPIFDVGAGQVQSRVVFEFNQDATMLLNFVPDQTMITFDNLVPPNLPGPGEAPKYTYVPDGTYDFFVWKKGRWVYQEGLFNNPNQPIKEAGSGGEENKNKTFQAPDQPKRR